jgi:internalin A
VSIGTVSFGGLAADSALALETEYIAPDLLPAKAAVADQLAGRWDDGEPTGHLEYEYAFLHQGILRALLCDVGERSGEAGVYWKFGVWVYEKATGCRAIIEQRMANERRGFIRLSVQGQGQEELAQWLRSRIEGRSRLFGYPKRKAIVDTIWPLKQSLERGRLPLRGVAGIPPDDGPCPPHDANGIESLGVQAADEPVFEKPPASLFTPREPQVFVSFAWGDDTPEGRQRAKLVDDLCVGLARQGVKVRRDRDEIQPGDLISEFMDRLADGDRILAVISDKYLRSDYCMYELFRIWRNCADQPRRFVRKVIPLILPDAKLGSLEGRLNRSIYWKEQEENLKSKIESQVDAVGTELFRKYKLIGEFAHNTSNMLEHLVDKLQPRDLDRQAKEGFKELLDQIRKSP